MTKHPTALPDEVARKLSYIAREHGYVIQVLTLGWNTTGLGAPLTASVTYEPDLYEMQSMDGSLTRTGEL